MTGESVITRGSANPMPNCNHEEADTRIVVHVRDALHTADTVLVRTVDTDVVVILVGKFYDLKVINPDLDIWVAFGMGRNYKFLSINKVCKSLGEQKSRGLPVFHAFSGCDTTSAFNGKGKRSAWQAWSICNELVTPSFAFFSAHPFHQLEIDSPHFHNLERLAVVMYDKSSPVAFINEARMDLFCKHKRAIEHLPPTQVNKKYVLERNDANDQEKCLQCLPTLFLECSTKAHRKSHISSRHLGNK